MASAFEMTIKLTSGRDRGRPEESDRPLSGRRRLALAPAVGGVVGERPYKGPLYESVVRP